MPLVQKSFGAARSDARSVETITSRDNRWLKQFRAALCHGPASDAGLVGVEGPHLVEEALRAGLEIAALLVSKSAEASLAPLISPWTLGPETRVLRTTDRLFAGVAGTESPQGIAALVHPRAATFDDLLRGGLPLVVVLVGVQDPGNVGTIVRSAAAFGSTGVAATRGTAHPLGPKALRASAGSALRLPIVSGIAPAILLAQLRSAGLKLFAASTAQHSRRVSNELGAEFIPTKSGAPPNTPPQQRGLPPLLPQDANLRVPAALLIGNEGAGLPPEIENSADALLHIPLAPDVESLNAAVAASVLLYEASRQRSAQL